MSSDYIRTDEEYNFQKASLAKVREQFKYQRQNYMAQGMTEEQARSVMYKDMGSSYTFTQMRIEDLELYEQLRSGKMPDGAKPCLGVALIWFRIASGFSQEQLAERLGLEPKQVALNERNDYHGVSKEMAQKVLDALGDQAKEGIKKLVPDFSDLHSG